MANKDYYKILEISSNANLEDIKKAYRKLALKYHPDKTKGDKESEKHFKEINEAYRVLSDPAKRRQYDQFGQTFEGAAGGGFSGFRPEDFNRFTQDFSDLGGFNDIFESFFGGTRSARQKPEARLRGRDVEVNLKVTFDEAAFGVTKEVGISRLVVCQFCDGTGSATGRLTVCDKCSGSGEIRSNRRTILGMITQVQICDVCKGLGKKPEKICRHCRGDGRINKTEQIKIDIPAGIDSGQTIKLVDQGEAGFRGAPAGDLYIVIHVLESLDFKRQGSDLYRTEILNYPTAVLGGEIKVKSLTKDLKLKVPSGTKSGEVFRLKSKGLPKVGQSGQGDLFIKVEIDIPKRLNLRQKRILEELKEEF